MRARFLHGAVLAALTTTGVAWVSLDKSVTVEIDGLSRVVVTHASTVSEVLDRAGVKVDPHDMMAPTGGARVRDGSRIVIKRGRLVTVRVNEVERGVWVNASDVDQVLHEIGVDTDERAFVSASRSSRVPSTGSFTLQVRMPAEVALTVDEVTRTVVTTAPTVAEMLSDEGVALSENDDVNLPLASYPVEGTSIVVQDRRGERVARTRPIAFKTVQRVDPKAAAGSTRVLSPGAAGVLVRYYRQTTLAGVGTVLVPDGTRVARAPRDRVLVRGPAPKPAAVRATVPKPVARKPVAKSPAVKAPAVKAPAVTRPAVKKPAVTKPVPKPAAPRPVAPKPVARKPAPAPAHKPAADTLNWHALAMCESGNNPRAVSRGGTYRGLYQFMLATWRGVGGVGDPINASRDEQTYRAQILFRRAGSRAWGSCGSRLYR